MKEARRAFWSVNAIFMLHGVIVANWLSRIPAVQRKLGLSVGALGASLLCTAAGALCGMPVAARLVGRYGSAAVSRISTLLFCLVLPLPGVVTRGWMLGPALFILGFAAASMEVSMNTQGVMVERRGKRPVMTTFHAMFSLGGMIGAGMGGLAAGLGISPAAHLLGVMPVIFVLSAVAARNFIADDAREVPAIPAHWTRHVRALWALGTIAFCILIGEGAMADWSAVYLNGLRGVSAAMAAAGYAVFSVCMAAGRLGGDWLRGRLAEVSIVRWGAGLACVGLGCGLFAGNLAGGLAGFACAGFGFSTIFPILTLRAGHVEGVPPQTGIAAVTAMGYTGFLTGPPLIGFLAQAATLRVGLGVVPLLSAVAVILSGKQMRADKVRDCQS